ncbi:MAG: FMN-binding protein [Clostridia bacterium]|nr:FMN-binding protein [Clostridia bacterium]
MQGKDIREILKIGLILFAITAIAAGILAVVNSVTAPIIAENAIKKRDAAMMKVLPDAKGFEQVEFSADNTSVTEVYSGGDVGYVVLCEPNGYSGAISLVVGVKADGTVSGIDITSQSETAGLGSNCTNDEFKAQFVGKTKGISVVKQGADGNEIDAISSATKTSKAVTKGVNDALSAVAEIKGEGLTDEK